MSHVILPSSSCLPIPSDPLGYNFSQHSPTTRPAVEKTAEKVFMLSDRVELSSAEARVAEIKDGSVGVLTVGHEEILGGCATTNW